MKFISMFLLPPISLVWAGEVVVDAPKEITREWETKVFGIKYEVTELDNALHKMVDGLTNEMFDRSFNCNNAFYFFYQTLSPFHKTRFHYSRI